MKGKYIFVVDRSDNRNSYLYDALIREGYSAVNFSAGEKYPIDKRAAFLFAPAKEINDEIEAVIPDESIMFCFRCEAGIEDRLIKRKVKIYKYFDDELLAMRNAYITAEGTLSHIILNTDISLKNMEVLVLGGGRVGKSVAKLLHDNRCIVGVATRDISEYAFASIFADEVFDLNEFEKELRKYQVIVNTIPSLILDSKKLEKVQKNCFIIDLASKPGGIDFGYAEKHNLNVMHALGIPGKIAPRTAGENIKTSVLDILLKDIRRE